MKKTMSEMLADGINRTVAKKSTSKDILVELDSLAHELTDARVADNKSVTAITSSSSSGSKTFYEPAFSGCGAVWFSLPKSDWRVAKELGFKKGYREYTYGYEYWNGQFGDACRGYNKALDLIKAKYSNNAIIQKLSTGSWID